MFARYWLSTLSLFNGNHRHHWKQQLRYCLLDEYPYTLGKLGCSILVQWDNPFFSQMIHGQTGYPTLIQGILWPFPSDPYKFPCTLGKLGMSHIGSMGHPYSYNGLMRYPTLVHGDNSIIPKLSKGYLGEVGLSHIGTVGSPMCLGSWDNPGREVPLACRTSQHEQGIWIFV